MLIPRDHDLSIPITDDSTCSSSRNDQVSILCWNVLSQSLFEKDARDCDHLKLSSSSNNWSDRLPRILEEISIANADVVCLQEVEFLVFERDLLPALTSLDYDGLVNSSNRRSSGNAHSVATFWKRSVLQQLTARIHRSRTLTTVLRDGQNRLLAVVNAHLEGHPSKSVARVKQLHTTLRELSTKHSHHAVIICGDFNSQLQSSAASAYLSFGACPPQGVLEWNRPIPEDVASIPSHEYDLTSSYGSDPYHFFTYIPYPNHPVSGLDQIWHSFESIDCIATRNLFMSQEQKKRILEEGLPSELNPSDHLPIGAVYRWKQGGRDDDVSQLKDLRILTTNDDQNNDQDPVSEAAELLEACPFDNDDQRNEFEFVTRDIPDLPQRGKPSEEQLLMIKERRERKAKLLNEVSDEARQILERILKLQKKSAKVKR